MGAAFAAGLKAYNQKTEVERLEDKVRVLSGADVNSPIPDTRYTEPTTSEYGIPSYEEYSKTGKSMDEYTMSPSKKGTKDYEGFRDVVYKDTEGYDTIGYGHKLTSEEIASGLYSRGITKEAAEMLFDKDKLRETEQFYRSNPWAESMPNEVREVMDDMSFNMGGSWLDSWGDTKVALQEGNYKVAAKNIMDSKYASQVGQRAIDNANQIGGY